MSDHFIQTYTGKKVNPLKMTADDVDILDIAHSLALTNRFTGHTPEPYSVAQHSYIVSSLCGEKYKLWGLLHDAPEAYLADISRPVKLGLLEKIGPYLKDAEQSIMRAVCEKFGLQYTEPAIVKIADNTALANEAYAFFGHTEAYKDWHHRFENGFKKLDFSIVPLPWKAAKEQFLWVYNDLLRKNKPTDPSWQNQACDESGGVVAAAPLPTEAEAKAIFKQSLSPENMRYRSANIENDKDFITKDSGVRHEESTGAKRDTNKGKGRFDLISPIALLRLAQLCERGAEKYGDRNWEKGINLARYLDSAMRHLNDFRKGDRIEDHLAACAWNCFSFIHTEQLIKEGKLPKELDNLEVKP